MSRIYGSSGHQSDPLSNMGVVVGIALLLAGIGFIVLALGALRLRDDRY